MTYGPPPGGGWGDPGHGSSGYGSPGYGSSGYGSPTPGYGQLPGYGPQPAYGAGAPRQGAGARFSAGPVAAQRSVFTIIGATLAFLGLVMVIFSFLSWATASNEVEGREYSASITGFGSGTSKVDGKTVEVPKGYQGDSDDSNKKYPGAWTVAFGVLIVLASVPLLARKGAQWGVVGAGLVGLAATIASAVFLANPIQSLSKKDIPDDTADHWGAGFGLWIVFFASVIALFLAIGALVLLLLPDKAPSSAGGTWPPTQGGYPGAANPAAQQTQFNPTAQPTYPSDPGGQYGGATQYYPGQYPGQG